MKKTHLLFLFSVAILGYYIYDPQKISVVKKYLLTEVQQQVSDKSFSEAKPASTQNQILQKNKINLKTQMSSKEPSTIEQSNRSCELHISSFTPKDMFLNFIKVTPPPIDKETLDIEKHLSLGRCELQKCAGTNECVVGYTIHRQECPGVWAPVNEKHIIEFYDQYIYRSQTAICDSETTEHPPPGATRKNYGEVKCINGVCQFVGNRIGHANYCNRNEKYMTFKRNCYNGNLADCIEAIDLARKSGQKSQKMKQILCKGGKIEWCYNLAIEDFDFDKAVSMLDYLCKTGHFRSCFDWGRVYWNSNYDEALKHFRLAQKNDANYLLEVWNFFVSIRQYEQARSWLSNNCKNNTAKICTDPVDHTDSSTKCPIKKEN